MQGLNRNILLEIYTKWRTTKCVRGTNDDGSKETYGSCVTKIVQKKKENCTGNTKYDSTSGILWVVRKNNNNNNKNNNKKCSRSVS